MVEELLHYFCCFECNSLFAIGCVKGCAKHVSSVVGAAKYSGKSKWGLSNGGLRPLSAICAQSSTIVHFSGLFGSLFKGNFRHKMTTIVGNRGQLRTSTLSPHLLSPHLDFPEVLQSHPLLISPLLQTPENRP